FAVTLGLDCATPAPTPLAARAPGSLSSPSTEPALAAPYGIEVAIDDDLLNRVLHGVWASGALELDLDRILALFGATPATPGAAPLIAAGDLKQLVPELGPLVADTAPVSVSIAALLPPIVRVG